MTPVLATGNAQPISFLSFFASPSLSPLYHLSFFLLRQMFTESNWHVRSSRSSDRESQPEKQRWPSHRSSSFAMISNSHFKKKLGSTIWISKENKKKENEKRKTETPSSVSCQIRMQSSLHESLKEEGGELRLWLAQKNRSTTNIRLTQKPKIQFPFKNTKMLKNKKKKAKAVKLDYLLFLRVRSRERL